MKEKGLFILGVSLDGGSKEAQDSFRGVEGTFFYSKRTLNYAKELSIPVQVNSTLAKETIKEVKPIYFFLKENFSSIVRRWSLFFLVPTGRGSSLAPPSLEEIKEIFLFLNEVRKEAPFRIKTTEAPFFRIYIGLEEVKKGKSPSEIFRGRRWGFGIRDGNGVVFISSKGAIYPSGFLPIYAGNIRENSLLEVYQKSKIFQELRDTSLLRGKCGKCIFKDLCGGSRSRAYFMKGSYLEEDPLCPLDKELEEVKKEAFSFY